MTRSPIGASPIGGTSEALEEQEEMSPSVSQIAPAIKRADLGSEPSAAERLFEAVRAHLIPTLADWAEQTPEDQGRYAAVAAAFSPEPSAAWRPIESAPRDGTDVLTYRSAGLLAVAAWFESATPAYYGPDGWYVTDGAKILNVTHWQPLPGAPA